MVADARRGRFDVVLVWASDRIARSVTHFLDVLDELNRLNIEYVSFRENIDTGGPLGRAIVIIVGAVAELERNLIVERVRAGIRRAPRRPAHRAQSSGTGQRRNPARPWPGTKPRNSKGTLHLRRYRLARAPCADDTAPGKNSLNDTLLLCFKRSSKTSPVKPI
jgi:hypothetical protein